MTLGLARGWHLESGEDLSLHDGVTLGRAARWLLWQLALQPGVKLFAALVEAASRGVDGFVADDSLPPLHAQVAACAAQALGLPLERSAGGAAPGGSSAWRSPELSYSAPQRAALRVLDACGRAHGGRSVLCAWYHTLDGVLPELKRLGLRPVLVDKPPKSRLARLARLGVGAWTEPHEPPRLDASARRALDVIAERWRLRRASPGFAGLCRWRGKDLRGFAAPLLDSVVERDFPALAWSASRLRERWRRERPVAAMLPYDGPPLQQLVLQVARLEGTPSAVLLHGLPLGYRFRLEHGDSDAFLVWGPEQERLYRAAGAANQVRAVGNPYFDRYAASPAREPRSRSLLLLSHPLNLWSPRAKTVDPERCALEMVDAALAAGGWEVTLKLHPSESVEHYRRLLAGRPVRIERDIPVAELIARSTLVAGSFSTVLAEALLAGRPVLCVNLTGEIDPPPFDGAWGHTPVRSRAELEARLREAPSAPPREQALTGAFLGPVDGSASRRVAEAVAALAGARA